MPGFDLRRLIMHPRLISIYCELTKDRRPKSVADYEALAWRKLSHFSRAFIWGVAGDGNTYKENRRALDETRYLPSAAKDVSRINAADFLFPQGGGGSHRWQRPFGLAPTGAAVFIHPRGELAIAQAAAETQTPMFVSMMASFPFSEIRKAGDGPMWMGIYPQEDIGATLDLISSAKDMGFSGVCVSIDSPVHPLRDDWRCYRLPKWAVAPNLAGFNPPAIDPGGIYGQRLSPKTTWGTIDKMASITGVPLLVKGIMRATDAQRAINSGAVGVVVSNHGGRGPDGLPATATVLPGIRDAIAETYPVIVDGGVRRGEDILKYLMLGATAVLIGRSYLFGLAVSGRRGVRDIIQILHQELLVSMALLGIRNLSEARAWHGCR